MSKEEKNKIEEQDIIEEVQDELDEIENIDGTINEEKILEYNTDLQEENLSQDELKYKDLLAKTMADFDNFKKRTQRDKDDMIFFLKQDIFKKILPRLDDMERIIKNTPDDLVSNALYQGIVSLQTKLLNDLSKLGVEPFQSIGELINPDFHDVMTTIPGKSKDVIFDEFEKGYKLGDKILRHAKVIVGAGE